MHPYLFSYTPLIFGKNLGYHNLESLSPAGVELVGDVAQERLVSAKMVKGFSAQSPRPTVADRIHYLNISKEFGDGN